jgi:hypothetical protein
MQKSIIIHTFIAQIPCICTVFTVSDDVGAKRALSGQLQKEKPFFTLSASHLIITLGTVIYVEITWLTLVLSFKYVVYLTICALNQVRGVNETRLTITYGFVTKSARVV